MAAPADGLADFLLTAGAGAGGLNIARVAISNQATRRRRRVEAAMIAGGWAAMAAAFWFNPVWDARPPTQLWGAVLVVATGVGTVMALVAIDVVYVWRSSAARFDRDRLVGLALGAGAWLWGGLLDVVLAQLAFLGRSGVRDVPRTRCALKVP